MRDILAVSLAGPLGAALATVAVALLAWVCHRLAAYLAERTKASRVARLLDALGSQADGIAASLVADPALTVQAAIERSVVYVKGHFAETIAALRTPDDALRTRLENEVAARQRSVATASAGPGQLAVAQAGAV